MKNLTTTILLIILSLRIIAQPVYIHKDNQDIFLNGINLAWLNFANDLGNFDEGKFTQAITGIKSAGGNAVRWWIHVNGTYNPTFTNGKVSGINLSDLKNLKTALDIAYSNGVLLDLCLWSFDMLKISLSTDIKNQNKALLTDSACLQAYIDSALIPMVKYLKSHPGILCWEIFNEPEGMCSDVPSAGWSDLVHIKIKDIQTVVNRCAGAIHRTDSNVLVTNGSWSFIACNNNKPYKNYYSDSALIANGKDPLGILNFYMVHYYSWGGNDINPFVHPASYWNLDKKIVIGEFAAHGPLPSINPVQAYTYLYNNGYAGALSWTWTNHDGNGGLPDCAPALDTINTWDPEHVNIILSDSFDYPPKLKKSIPGIFVYKSSTNDTITVGKLHEWITDKEDSAALVFNVDSASDIAKYLISDSGYLKIIPIPNVSGISNVKVTATDTSGKTLTTYFVFSIIDSTSSNRFKFRNAFASSFESNNLLPINAVDNSLTTRWASMGGNDKEWLLIRLDSLYTLEEILIYWEAAYGKQYEILVSSDSINWQSVYTENNSDGSYDKIIFSPVQTKYVLVKGIQRFNPRWGYSIYEIYGYSAKHPNSTPYFAYPNPETTVNPNATKAYAVSGLAQDPDLGDKISYSFTQLNGSNLPSWLSYNDSTKKLTMSPTESDTGIMKLLITATDIEDAQVTDTLTITVPVNTLITKMENKEMFNAYPNPTNGIINLSWNLKNKDQAELSVVDILGKTLIVKIVQPNINYYSMNINNLKSGIYLIKLKTSGNILTRTIQIVK